MDLFKDYHYKTTSFEEFSLQTHLNYYKMVFFKDYHYKMIPLKDFHYNFILIIIQ